MSHPSQFTLLGKRRFLPFFITQSLGAFNDNLFKQSLILAILYKLSLEAIARFGSISARCCSSCRSFCSRHWPGSSASSPRMR